MFSEDSDILTANNIGEEPLQLKLLCGANIFETFAYPGLWKREDVRCKFCFVWKSNKLLASGFRFNQLSSVGQVSKKTMPLPMEEMFPEKDGLLLEI